MAMPAYPIYCYTKGSKNLATHKIAARWSDGKAADLKTYGLCCEACLPTWFRQSRERQQAGHLAPGETLEPCGIFGLQRGSRDQHLNRMTEIEQAIIGSS